MNKILIGFIILIVLIILSLIIYLLYKYFTKRKIQNNIINHNLNIDIYNNKYNLNYYNNKYIDLTDLSKLIKTEAVIIEKDIKPINIKISDDNIILYKYEIMYDIDNYFFKDKDKDKDIDINELDDFLNNKIILKDTYDNDNYILIQLNKILDKPNRKIKVFSTILTNKDLDVGDYLNVYYELNKDGGRIAPPFLDNDYIKFFDKK